MADKKKRKRKRKKGTPPRFQRGSDDLDQLSGVERAAQHSRKRRKKKRANGPSQSDVPLIDRYEKSKKRVRNRFDRIRNFEDADEEFNG